MVKQSAQSLNDIKAQPAINHSSPYGKGGNGKIPYPTHVWSPAGGWYSQPANWKANTMIMGAVIFGITAMAWSLSAQLEERPRMPEKGRFYPSRYWSKQIIEHEAKERAREKETEQAMEGS